MKKGELQMLRTFAHEATKTITNLVGGGSELFAGKIGEIYIADLKLCRDRIRYRETMIYQRFIAAVTELRDLKERQP